ncbi:MAG: divalent-cation tolerance protein CutA [Gammaproteobacteria bacterium]
MDAVLPYRLVLTTCPNTEVASRIAQALVKERLAACVNVLPAMQSVYRWRGNLESASEHLLLIKIRADNYAAVEERIRALHSYELPEVIAVPLVGGLAAYLAWIDNPDTTS